jgi:long-chain acyl-CoA synthetase
MKGYWRNQAETDKVIIDGWLHTGDIGYIDEAGRVAITDRKKDLIVNDKGDNIAPQKVEGMLTLQPEILQAMITGDKRPYMVAAIVPDPEWALEWSRNEVLAYDFVKLQSNPVFKSAVREAVDRVNKNLSVVEKVRRFEFADEPYAIENEELTPSMKIRRHVIKARYQDRLDRLYKK